MVAKIHRSVGVVRLREHFDAIDALRRALRPEVYLWINAFKRQANYYRSAEIDRLLAIGPYFRSNTVTYSSAGKPCRAGETTFAVDGSGDIRRCHFIDDIVGNIYAPGFGDCLKSRACASATCGCHIGYIHRPALGLGELYGDRLLERIPGFWPEVAPDFARDGLRWRSVGVDTDEFPE